MAIAIICRPAAIPDPIALNRQLRAACLQAARELAGHWKQAFWVNRARLHHREAMKLAGGAQ